ncbi:MAG: rod shape-determining protein MreD [Lachnospiraceae bacterium]|jgi:rod shape-determining protein MreD|nr:rod shape-determining protein MreD [Lachnospiraceae bacterium]MCI9600430.1 rod shape-determining protein MreD [Lachnospiraceae bacterium]MDE6895097.1 rod shape-determining protein MreD [Lachnospiraceae bacterium]
MKRRIVTVLIILIGFLFQCTVFKTLSIGSISPNLMVIITSSFGFMKGKKEGLWVGFFCGLLEDIFYGRLLGMHAVIYMYIGYANGYFNHIFYGEDIKLPIFLISASELAYGLGHYVIMFMMRSRFAFFYYLTRIILPELLYTIVVTLLFYRLIYGVNRRLDKEA